MRVPLAAMLVCLCGAASAATCSKDPPASPQPALQAPGGWLLETTAWQSRPEHQAQATAAKHPAAHREPRHDERSLLLAGIALMAGIALRRTGGLR